MLDIIKGWVTSHALILPGDKILVACSGGPDSLALLHILNRLKEEYSVNLAVACVNHMFRPEAAEEAEYVAAFSASLGLKSFVTAINVSAYAAANKMSAQEAARRLRYQYLRSVAAEWGGAKIATGHHRDDQVETVLINLLRGAGSGGLRGIQPENGGIIRPLLAVSRRDIEAYCTLYGLQPRYDSSNSKTNYLRNRVRLKLLPTLEADYNPAIREALWRLSELAGDEHDYLSREAALVWGTVAVVSGTKVAIDSKALAGLHKALQRELIRQVIEKKRGVLTGISYGHVEKLLTMALSGTVGSLLPLPGGLIAVKTYEGLELADGIAEQPTSLAQGIEPAEVAVPGITTVGGMKILAEIVTGPLLKLGRDTGVFDLESLSLPLTVRTRQPGDRFRPLGLGGSKKLKEFFIDSKVPEAERNSVLLIADQQEILWVAGYRQSEHGRITEKTQKILKLSITKREEF